jgi:hypothetical protein
VFVANSWLGSHLDGVFSPDLHLLLGTANIAKRVALQPIGAADFSDEAQKSQWKFRKDAVISPMKSLTFRTSSRPGAILFETDL